MRHVRPLWVLTALLLAVPLWAQFYWANDGVAVRQGLHLGWNGTAVVSGNEVTAFYYDCRRDGMRDIWGQRFNASGAKVWGNNGLMTAGDISEQRFPMATAYPDGSVLMVWEDYSAGRFRNLLAQRYNANGEPLWTPITGVTVIAEPHDQFNTKIALDTEDRAYIAFTDDRETIGGGEDERLAAYLQILTPDGQLVGPENGIHLVDRWFGHNVPMDLVVVNEAAYVLIESQNGGVMELELQKVTSDGTVAWPDDPAVVAEGDATLSRMAAMPGGLAIAWMDHRNDYMGDVRLLFTDYERNPLPGWPAAGVIVAEGTGTQAPGGLTAAPDSGIVIAWSTDDNELDLADLRLNKYARSGTLVFEAVTFGYANLQISPVELAWDGADLLVAWNEWSQDASETIRTQKLSSTGQKLWGSTGNAILTRAGKQLGADLVKPASGPARLFLLMGRSVNQPESLLTVTLNAQGLPNSAPETLSGGITYDIFDPQVAEIGYERALVLWSDSRGQTERDLYVQILNGQGEGLLEPNGRRITFNAPAISSPPALAADGQGGAFIAWVADSAGETSTLHVQHLDGAGNLLWSQPARVSALHGFQEQIRLVPDGNGGVYAAYSDFSPLFILRAHAVHVNAAGGLDWTPAARDFSGPETSDLLLNSAATDGDQGLFVAVTSGPWTGTDVTLFHLNPDGAPGANWTLAGRTFGETEINDQDPQLIPFGTGVVMTFLRANAGNLSTFSVRGIQVNRDGGTPWGSNPRPLMDDNLQVMRHVLTADGAGGFFVTWEDWRDNARSQVRINRFGADGYSLWDSDGIPVCSEVSDQNAPAVSVDGQGGAWIVWEDNRAHDLYEEIDLYATHLNSEGQPATVNGFTWPANGYPMVDLPTYQQEAKLIPWVNGSALSIWIDRRSSNPGRCCGAGAVGDIFNNIYGQVLSEISLSADSRTQTPVPEGFAITSAYPNPFNPATQITYTLPQEMPVKLSIVNLLGQEVAVLSRGTQAAGVHTVTWEATSVASGIYFARLESAWLTAVKKLVVLK